MEDITYTALHILTVDNALNKINLVRMKFLDMGEISEIYWERNISFF